MENTKQPTSQRSDVYPEPGGGPAKRRDFTINAMAYNETEGLIDIFGGLKDIEAKLIRCVGNGRTFWKMRCGSCGQFVFAQLGYEIHEDTEANPELAPTLQKISAERIRSGID